MGGHYNYRLVNGESGDPAVYIQSKHSALRMLFDLGDISSLTVKDILKCNFAFVSHTHMDHFVGFVHWLRIHVPHFSKLHIAGPAGLAKNVQSALRSYTWNLVTPDQIDIIVREVDAMGKINSYQIRNTCQFELETVPNPTIEIVFPHKLPLLLS